MHRAYCLNESFSVRGLRVSRHQRIAIIFVRERHLNYDTRCHRLSSMPRIMDSRDKRKFCLGVSEKQVFSVEIHTCRWNSKGAEVSDYGVILCLKMSALENSRLTAVLVDISGVLLEDSKTAIPGSAEAVRKLREAGLQIRLVTNETQITREKLAATFIDLGFCVQEQDIIPPYPALITLLKRENMRPHLLVHHNILPEFDGIDQSNPNCVVLGDASDNFTYENLNEAFRILINMEKPRLFSLGRGRYHSDKGVLVLDVGAFTAALEYAADIQAEVIGKPHPEFFMSALRDMGVEPQEAVMIGDDIVSDVGGAQHCGLTGVLVRTGKYRPSDEKHPTVHPDAIVDDLAQAVDLILKSRQ